MAKIQVSSFQGIAPRLDARLLGEQQGQIGENLRLTSLALQSWREPVSVDIPARSGMLETIYRYEGTGSPIWLTWNTDVDVVKAPLSNDTTKRLYWTGDGKPKAGDNADNTVTGIAATGGSGIYPENSITLGAPAPTTAPTVAIGGAGAGTTPIGVIYVYTFVSFWGEESSPSPASAIINVDLNDGDVDLSAMETTWPAEYNTLDKIRIYRSNSGVNSTAYQFVAEITPAATYTDNTAPTGLGEVIVSTDFDLPPDDMFGLLDAGNGILVGFTEFEILFCEPFQPHAWPVKYRLAVVDKIVGGGIFGNTIVVCTDDQPVLVVGNHPSTMTMTIHPDHQACVAKQGIVQMKGAVVYPSPNGLYMLGYGGGRLLTEPLYDRETWQERNPAQLRATHWDTRYIGFTDSAGLVVETANNVVSASDFNIDVDSIYADAQNDDLYICQSTPVNTPRAAQTFTITEATSGFYTGYSDGTGAPPVIGSISPGTIFSGDAIRTASFFTLGPSFSLFIEGNHPQSLINTLEIVGHETVTQADIAGFQYNATDDQTEWSWIVSSVHWDGAGTSDIIINYEDEVGSTNEISEFNVGGKRISYRWRSKKFSLGSQVTLTAGKILAQYGELYTQAEVDALAVEAAAVAASNSTLLSRPRGALNEHAINSLEVNGSLLEYLPEVPTVQNVVLKLYADGVLIGTATANSDEPFRLPSGERNRQYEIEIETFTDVNQITLASSVSDLL